MKRGTCCRAYGIFEEGVFRCALHGHEWIYEPPCENCKDFVDNEEHEYIEGVCDDCPFYGRCSYKWVPRPCGVKKPSREKCEGCKYWEWDCDVRDEWAV